MSKLIRLKMLLTLVVSCLVGCNDVANFAPVTELSAMDKIPQTGFHRVQPGETLYEIAWRYGLDYRYLAERNQIAAPYTIHVNDQIALQDKTATVIAPTQAPTTESNGVITPKSEFPAQSNLLAGSDVVNESLLPAAPNLKVVPTKQSNLLLTGEPHFKVSRWLRPAKGPTVNYFSNHQKGIDIAGVLGEPVVAAADGKVVYSGNGLKRYGNLIILKHNHLYLSAYAHNQRIYVHEGDWVKQGQKIADMGNTGTKKVMLHFEIRKAGKPINPSSLLGS